MVIRAIKYMLVGAVVGGLAGWFMFGGAAYNATSGNFGWGPIMAPTFALIGAIVGLLEMVLVSTWRRLKTRVNASAEVQKGGPYRDEWENPSNWTGRLFYKSSIDRRIFVPQTLPGGWYTINLGHPFGIAIAVILLVLLTATLVSLVTRW
jgi:uncharacterized membrane protein